MVWCPNVKCEPISGPPLSGVEERGEGWLPCQLAEEGAEGGREGGGLERGEVETGRLWPASPHLTGMAGELGRSRSPWLQPFRFLGLNF